MASQLCNRCKVVFQGIFEEQDSHFFDDEDWDGFNQFSLDYTILSSKKGCQLCSRLLGEVQRDGKSTGGPFEVSINLSEQEKSLGRISFYSKDLNEFIFFDVMDLKKLGGTAKPDWVSSIAETDNTFSQSNIDMSKRWLTECLHHADCAASPSATRTRLPARLLDVDGTTSYIRLCLTNHLITMEVSYMTLSHCWGDPKILQPVKLTKERLEAYLKLIDCEDLPKTFQDAVSICRSFGCKYLWIDALCIIQGDKEDWLKEGLRMDEIYGSSLLNIAAALASDGNGGCFAKRDPKSIRGFKVEGTSKGAGGSLVTAYCTVESERLFEKNVVKTPLISRAWVFQERYLAPRTLYFGLDQLFWECRSSLACETYPFGIYQKMYNQEWSWSKRRSTDSHSPWSRVISAFSVGSFTYDSDKLVALSGVAKHFAAEKRLKGADYLAGLWRSDIIEQLRWYSIPGSTRKTDIQIPSWSWLSISSLPKSGIHSVSAMWAAFGTYGPVSDYKIRLLEADVNRTGDMYGDIEGGFLKLQCETLVRAGEYPLIKNENKSGDGDSEETSSSSEDSDQNESTSNLSDDLEIDDSESSDSDSSDSDSSESEEEESRHSSREGSTGRAPEDSILYPDEEIDESRGQIFLMPYCYKEAIICFLLLQAKTGVRGTYRRVGIRYDEGPNVQVAFQEAQLNSSSCALDSDYEEVLGPDESGKPQYVIRII